MSSGYELDVARWGAVIAAESEEQLGAAGAAEEIPAQLRRRLPKFTRNVLRCALPLVRSEPAAPIVYTAEHGDMDSTVKLLGDLAHGELLSPALFTFSVHNAPVAALSLCVPAPGDHVAIAAGPQSFAAGLTDVYARLASGAAEAAVLIVAEARLPEVYRSFDEDTDDVFLALHLKLTSGGEAEGPALAVEPHRRGVVKAVRALANGADRLRFHAPHAMESAA